MSLTPAALQRYARHVSLPEVGVAGQARLAAASALIVGAGGLGSPVALYLAAAGVGHIGIVDDDRVDVSNLQRQIIHTDADIGQRKVASACAKMLAINPLIQVTPHAVRVTASNVLALVQAYDVIIDATDSFATRYMLNDACVLTHKPLVYGAIFRFEGQVSVFAPHLGGPCYRCLFPDPPTADLAPNCAQTGVFGVLPGVVGTVQATEALKLILGIGETLIGRLWLYDALRMQADAWAIAANPACPRCGTQPTLTDIVDMEAVCAAPVSAREIDVHDAFRRLAHTPAPLLLDVRDDHEYAAGHVAGAVHIPVDALAMRLHEIPTGADIIVYCRSGMRSARACDILRRHAYTAVSLAGGMLAWRQQIDATLDVV